MLPRVWTVSPPGILPAIQVSGLDLLQARALKRTAARSMRSEQWAVANYSWLAAWSHNPADVTAVRGILESWLKSGERGRTCDGAAAQAWNLLRLTNTNSTDLLLAVQTLEEAGNANIIPALLEPRLDHLPPPLTKIYLKRLLEQKKLDAFATAWTTLEAGASATVSLDLQLLHAAYQGMAGSSQAAASGIEALNEAALRQESEVLAWQLQLIVTEHRSDLAGYSEALSGLRHRGVDRFSDHLGHCRLLARLGREKDAIETFDSWCQIPKHCADLLAAARFLRDCGREDRAIHWFELFGPDFGHVAAYWLSFGNELLRAQQWESLRRVAIAMRNRNLHRQLAAFSFYLEGRAELGLQRAASASAAFRKILDWKFPSSSLATQTAAALLGLGETRIALQILLPWQTEMSQSADYWMLLFTAADRAREPALMLAAGRRAFELRPNHPLVLNNFAAALLINRQQPEQAMGLALLAKSQNPHSAAAAVNYGAALLQNHRLAEASEILHNVPTNQLNRAQSALYLLDLFELRWKLGELEIAEQISHRIEMEHLYPPQRQWFERTLRQLSERRTG